MLTTIQGYYDQGKITLKEIPTVTEKTEVIVTFLNNKSESKNKTRTPGGLKGLVSIPDDFNEPLEDLKEYM